MVGRKTGIQWSFTKQLEDLDFANDISLLSHRQQDVQEKLNCVAEEAEKTGLQNRHRQNRDHEGEDPVRLHQENITGVKKLVYLGSVINKNKGTEEDTKCQINKMRHAFKFLRPIWKSTALFYNNTIWTLRLRNLAPMS
jgi:hypothetical protein